MICTWGGTHERRQPDGGPLCCKYVRGRPEGAGCRQHGTLRGSLYAHTGRQIKNGTESLKGREVSTNAVALYGSNISIEDFLGSVKEELGENLSANVKYAFGMDTETTAGFGEGLRYSVLRRRRTMTTCGRRTGELAQKTCTWNSRWRCCRSLRHRAGTA